MNYRYKAKDKHGKSVSGIVSGEDGASVAKSLSAMGYIPIAIDEAKASWFPMVFEGFSVVPQEDMNVFTRQLATLQKAGIPILMSLDTLEKQSRNKYFKDVIKDMVGHVESGMSLSDAMGKYPHIFTDLYVNMVKAGEASGLLDEILSRLAEFGEKEIETRSKISAATRYPLITLGALFAAFAIVVTFVIPRFAAIFAQFKTQLPLPTRILLGLSGFIQCYWYMVLMAIAAAVYFFYKYINTKNGRMRWDGFKLKMPLFGGIISMLAMSRFARTTALLIKSGLPILQVLDMSAKTVGNAVVAKTIDNVAVSVREGKGISEPMKMGGVFPPIITQMVAIGEDTGKVDELLMKVAEYYDQQSDYSIRNITTLIEPLFILVLGIMVLVMALAIFLPMWNMLSLFRH